MDAYIISYFGKDKKTRLIRIGYHYYQLTWLLEMPGIENIHILSMDYDHKYITCPENIMRLPHPRIIYHDSELVPPSQARNKLIKIFNETDKDWGLFLDNDSIIDPRFDGREIINIIERNLGTINADTDLMTVVSPRQMPFSGFIEKNAEKCQSMTPMKHYTYLKSSLFFLKNFPKFGEEPIYFDEELAMAEDTEYAARLASKGKIIRMISTVILQEFGLNDSTLFPAENGKKSFEKRQENLKAIYQMMYERYKDYGAEMNKGEEFKSIKFSSAICIRRNCGCLDFQRSK